MANQLYTKENLDKKNVFPKNYTDNIRDKETNRTLTEILQGFNCHFLSFTGDTETTLLEVPISARKQGVLVTYTDYTDTVYIKFYNNKSIEDEDFKKESNWKELTKINAGIEHGDTRPSLESNDKNIGFMFFDTTLNKPIYWTGSKWVDAIGAEV